MTFKHWVVELFKDERGSTSVKPVIGLFMSFCLGASLVVNSLCHGALEPSDTLVEAIVWVIIAAIAGDVADKFSYKAPKQQQPPPNDEELV